MSYWVFLWQYGCPKIYLGVSQASSVQQLALLLFLHSAWKSPEFLRVLNSSVLLSVRCLDLGPRKHTFIIIVLNPVTSIQ